LVKVVLEGHAVASNVERRTSNVADLSSLTSHQPATGEPWPRISYVKEFTARFGVHPDQASADQLIKLCGQHNVQAGSTEPEHEMIDRLFNAVMMPELMLKHVQFFLCEYPVKCASLARRSSDGAYAERFEGYVQGLEICNGFTELVDEQEQRLRFAAEAEERRLAGKTVYPIDEELLFGLASIASPTYGNALGVDRLVMLKAGVKDIDSIHLFPPSQRF
jgi:lysyl-tRNA synthetase class 2